MGLEWLGGVALSVVGNVLINLGTNIMKLGHNQRMEVPSPRPAYKDKAWLIGFSLYACGNFASFFSFGYAAQSILAAIGCVQFVSNVIFASVVVKEQVTRRILGSTALIVAGCILLVVFGSHSSDVLDAAALQQLYNKPAYIAYLLVGGTAVAVTYALYWFGRRAIRSKHHKRVCWTSVLPVAYSVFSALICTQSLLFNKAVMILWRMTLAGENQFTKWFTWLMALGFVMTAGLWVVQLNQGLQMFPALVIVPCLQLFWTLFGVVSGMLYFQEYLGMTGLQQAMFGLGVAVVCMGAGILAYAQPEPGHDHDDKAAPHVEVLVDSQQLPCKGGNLLVESPAYQLPEVTTYASEDCDSHVHQLHETQPELASTQVKQPPHTASESQGENLTQRASIDGGGVHHLARRAPHGLSRLRTSSVPL